MLLAYLLLATAAVVAATGFSTYKEIREGSDNSATITYSELYRSSTLFLYIQIIAGGDHSSLVNDFKTLAQNWGSNGVGVIPRVRYGTSDGNPTTEPDKDTLMGDVALWSGVFSDVSSTIDIPVIQAGFLGQWGEWHDGQYCQTRGTADSAQNQAIKSDVVNELLGSGHKVALRYPQDHRALFDSNRTVTLHDDCIFDGGSGGYDGGTFPSDSRQEWVDYAKQVASDNTFGGEGCNDAGDATFDWSDTAALCQSGGIVDYINAFHIAYMNMDNPQAFATLLQDPDQKECADAIQQALEQWS